MTKCYIWLRKQKAKCYVWLQGKNLKCYALLRNAAKNIAPTGFGKGEFYD